MGKSKMSSRTFLIGIGAAANKAAIEAVKGGGKEC